MWPITGILKKWTNLLRYWGPTSISGMANDVIADNLILHWNSRMLQWKHFWLPAIVRYIIIIQLDDVIIIIYYVVDLQLLELRFRGWRYGSVVKSMLLLLQRQVCVQITSWVQNPYGCSQPPVSPISESPIYPYLASIGTRYTCGTQYIQVGKIPRCIDKNKSLKCKKRWKFQFKKIAPKVYDITYMGWKKKVKKQGKDSSWALSMTTEFRFSWTLDLSSKIQIKRMALRDVLPGFLGTVQKSLGSLIMLEKFI